MSEPLRPRDVERLRLAMAHTGDDSFFPRFRRLLRARLKIDTFLILRFNGGGVPELFNAWIPDQILGQNFPVQYFDGAYRFDPFFQFSDTPPKGGMFRLSDIAPDRFFSGEYYLRYYRQTELCDEVGLLVPLSDGSTGHLSFSRREVAGPFKRKELQCLHHYSPVLLELLRQYCEARLKRGPRKVRPQETPPLSDVIRARVTGSGRANLTRREGEVAGLVLQGHSNASAALVLGMARETAKVHRRNIYRKLGISSQAELFALMKDYF